MIVELVNIEFFKDKFINDFINLELIISQSILTSSFSDEKRSAGFLSEPKRSQRARKEKYLEPTFISSQSITFLVEGNRDSSLEIIPMLLNTKGDPKTYKEQCHLRMLVFRGMKLMMKLIL